MTFPAGETTRNTDPGLIQRRRSYWAAAVGTDIDLKWAGNYPREIRVGSAGALNVTFDDGTTEVIPLVPAGAVFRDCMWTQINASGSVAFAISVGW